MKIAVFSTKPYDEQYLLKHNQERGHDIMFFETALNHKTTDLTKGFDVVCVFVNDKLDARTLNKLKSNGVRLIALRCAGFNNVDMPVARELGLTVVRVPAYSPEAVAEHAVALIMTLNRKTHKAYNRIREGNFSLYRLIGFNLNKKTVGVIGTGKIGSAFCKIMNGFGCKIVAFDTYESASLKAMGVEYVPLEQLLQGSDIISLHCPLTTDTFHMINQKALLNMKDGVMLINTSRGALINTPDIIEALKSRKVGYLGIDVYEQEEKLFFNDLSENIIDDELVLRLISFPNVLITSHQAFLTNEALNQIALITLDNMEDFANGKPLVNLVE